MLAYVVCVFCGVLFLLFMHELGHLVAARWCGVRVIQISLGLGPELFGFTDHSGTRWTLAAFPLGASLQMSEGHPCSSSALMTGKKDTLSAKSLAQRSAIYAAGPLVSLGLACAIFGASFFLIGEAVTPGTYSEKPVVAIASLLAGFSFLVTCFQLIPIPPTDGGWLVVFGIEAITGKRAPYHIIAKLGWVGIWGIALAEFSILAASSYIILST